MLRPMVMSRGRIGAVLTLLLVAGCGEATGPTDRPGSGADDIMQGTTHAPPPSPKEQPVAGEAAVWNIDLERPPSAHDQSFAALVERLGCNNGETGQVLGPKVVEEPHQVVITFEVAPQSGEASCPGNRPVEHEVVLTAAVGDRALVDGACLSGPSVTTSHCLDGGERWPTADRE